MTISTSSLSPFGSKALRAICWSIGTASRAARGAASSFTRTRRNLTRMGLNSSPAFGGRCTCTCSATNPFASTSSRTSATRLPLSQVRRRGPSQRTRISFQPPLTNDSAASAARSFGVFASSQMTPWR